MALKNSDIARLLDVAKGNAGLKEQGLARSLGGSQALLGLDKYNTGRGLDLATALAGAGKTSRGIDQAKLDAAYQEFSNKTGYPLEISKLIISALAGSPSRADTTTTETKPDNSGWGLVGSLAGTALGSFLGPAGASTGGSLGRTLGNSFA